MEILATIDGEVPILATLPVKWELREGVVPVHNVFDFSLQGGAAIEKKRGKPVDLIIDDQVNNVKQEIKNIYVLHELPADNQFIRRFLFADRRWLWPYKHVRRIYNKRRKIGFKRLSDAANKTPEIQPVVEKLSYAPFSLELSDGARRTKAVDVRLILDELKKDVQKNEQSFSNVQPLFVNRPEVVKIQATPVEELTIDESLDQTINRIMEYMPGLGLYVDFDGKIIFYNKNSGNDKDLVEKLGPETVGGGHIIVSDLSFLAPSKINVLYDREVELRLDYGEGDQIEQKVGTVFDAEPDIDVQDQRTLDNVLPVTDHTLKIGNNNLPQGTWIILSDAIAAYNALAKPPTNEVLPGLKTLTPELIRRAMIPYIDFWSGLRQLGELVPDADWGARLGAIQSFYRRAFRIRQNLWERLLDVKPGRVATFDPTTGQRGTATVYCNYYSIATDRSMLLDRRFNRKQELAYSMNFAGRPKLDSIDATIDDKTPIAPATVTILDGELGILGIDFKPDIFHTFDQFAPGSIEINKTSRPDSKNHNLPTAPGPRMGTPYRRGWPQFFNSIAAIDINRNTLPQLSATWNLSVIVTALLGSPNNERALQKVTITPADVSGIVGNFDAKGPEMDVRVGSSIETARIAWKDSEKKKIEKLIGIRKSQAPVNVDDLVVNLDRTTKPGGASLRQIAIAAAARLWATFLNRPIGSATGRMTPGLTLDGWASEVELELATTGQTSTQIAFPERIPKLSMWSLLPPDVRHITMRLVKAR